MMKSGRYYIGDLCYVMNNQWDEFCSKSIINRECIYGEIVFDNGVKTTHFGTAHGDGNYLDQYDNEYPVDAGLIGCVLVSDISDPKADLDLGNIIDFDEDFSCYEDDGYIYFGHICINTNYDEEEDEYDEGLEDEQPE